jgi:hypothetical protein
MNISGVNFTGGFIVSPAVDPQFNYVTALLHGDGASAGTNNTFLDSSTNNFAITRTGNVTQGSFAPYSTLWSNYFNGSSDYLYIADNAAFNFGTGDATVEFWFNSPGTSNNYPGVISSVDYNVAGSASIRFDNTGYKGKAFMYINGGGDPVISSTSTIAYNTWNHIAIVRQGTSLKLYLNGALNTTVTISAGLGWYLSASGLRIGRGFDVDGVNGYYPGYISNVRLVKGTAVYTSNFTPSTTPLTAITNTSLLTCQSNRFVDNSTNNFAITVNGTPSVQPSFSPFGATTQYDPNVNGGSAYFNGSTDYLLVGSTPGPITPLISAGAVMTIEAWVNATTLRAGNANDTHPSIIGLGAVYMNFGVANGIPRFMWYNGAVTYLDSSIAITANTWNHIAVVFNGSGSSNLKIYVNGVLGGTGTFTNLTWSTGSGGNNLYIGAVGNNQATSCWPGYISNLRITNSAVYTTNFTPPTIPVTAITNTSLLLNFTNAQIFGSAMTNNFITVGNAQVSTSIYKYGTGSMYFDGTTGYLVAPNSPNFNFGTGDFTIESWVYFNGGISSAQMIVSTNYNATTGAGGWAFIYRGDISSLQLSVNSNVTYTKAWAPSVSVWYHVAVSRSGSNLRFFINGTQIGTTSTSSDNITGATTLVLGNNLGGTPNLYLNGYLDEFRMTYGYARYTSNFTAPTSQFPSTGPIPLYTSTVEYLLVAGGAAGGGRHGGGGGAGGVLSGSALPITIGTIYPITVGAGGAATTEVIGNNGINSVIGTSNSYSFNGSSQYLTVAANTALDFGTGDFTVECWVYPTSIANSYPTFLGSVTGWSAGASGHRYNNTGQANKFSFHLNGAGDPFMSSSGTFSFNTWYHYALTRSGNTWNMYVNGVLQSTQTSAIAYNPSLGGLRSGWSTWDGAGGYFAGNISNLRLVKGVTVYTGAFTPPTSPLTATQSAGTNISAITGVQTSLLTLQNSNLIDNSTYAFAITNTGSVLSYVTPFSLISSIGGGGGGVYPAMTANTGGSGGGAGSNSGSPTGAAGTAGQGNAGGGNTYNATNDTRATGGGGGAGGAGTSGTSTVQSNGGIGVVSSITGTSLYWGGGGGGSMWTESGPASAGAGNGGLGGGGGGSSQSHVSTASAAGTGGGSALNTGGNGVSIGGAGNANGGAGGANTGGGGGGCPQYYSPYSQFGISGAGGSGVVILRYPSGFALPSSTTGSPTITAIGGYNIYTWTSSGSITF